MIDEETHLRGYVIALTRGRCALDAPANPALGCTKEADCGGGRGSHFCVTQLKPQKRPDLQVVNQFHSSTTPLRVDAIKPDRLLVPTSKGLNGVPGTLPEPLTTDHYRCYKVALSKGSAKFEPIPNVAIDDQFITSVPKLFDLKKPSRLCIPVSKNGEKVNAPTVSLMCYQAVPAKGQPKHHPVKNLALGNQFGSELADTVKEEEFCVPSEVSASASPA